MTTLSVQALDASELQFTLNRSESWGDLCNSSEPRCFSLQNRNPDLLPRVRAKISLDEDHVGQQWVCLSG